MSMTEQALIEAISKGEPIVGTTELLPAYRGEVLRLMTIFVDTELAWAAGYADFINRAPGIRERVVTSRIVAEKLAHVQKVMSVLETFGVQEETYTRIHSWTARLDRNVDLGNRRVGDDKRLNVLHYPLEGWMDAVAMNALMGPATVIHLTELANASYGPLADAMKPVVEKEAEHAQLAEKGFAQATERQGRAAAQVAVDYWYPKVAATFGKIDSQRFEMYKSYGLRQHTNAQLLETWTAQIQAMLGRFGLAA